MGPWMRSLASLKQTCCFPFGDMVLEMIVLDRNIKERLECADARGLHIPMAAGFQESWVFCWVSLLLPLHAKDLRLSSLM